MESSATTTNYQIRPGSVADGPFLTELALRSKGYWDYDPTFLSDCRAELTISNEFVTSNTVVVIEHKGIPAGFYSLCRQSTVEVELAHLYVEPDSIGCGFGKLLWRHAVETAKRLGFQHMLIHSDPNAETFYKTMGATRIGEVESPVRAGRRLPLLRYRLSE